MSILVHLFFGVFCTGALAAALGPLGWPFDLFSHFQMPIFLGSVVFVLVFGLLKAPARALLSLGIAGYSGWLLASSALLNEAARAFPVVAPADASRDRADPALAGRGEISVRAANLFGKTGALEALLAEPADKALALAILTELPREAARNDRFPFGPYSHRIGDPAQAGAGQFATIILSTWPAHEQEALAVGENPSAILRSRFCQQSGGSCLTVFALHPPPPFRETFHLRQRAIFQRLIEAIGRENGPVLVAGDLNATPWSPVLREFVRKTGLRHVTCGYAFASTWMSHAPLLGLPLDHFLVGGGLRPTGCRTGAFAGSDHAPLHGRFVLP